MVITRETVAGKLAAYLHHEISLGDLVDWAQLAIMEGEFEEVDAGVPVIGGFHSPMEKECLELLLRGTRAVVICPARGIERLRPPAAWRTPLAEARLLVLSPFPAHHQRPTTALAEQRNRFVATLAGEISVAHAGAGSRTERLCAEIMAHGKRMYTLNLPENAHLVQGGVMGRSVHDLVELLVNCRKRIA